jgi:hypothetical protein
MRSLHLRGDRPVRQSPPGAAGRLRLLSLLVGAALVQMASHPVHADSGVGADTVLGNGLNPGGERARAVDPDGIGESQSSRTPSGLLESQPWLLAPTPKPGSTWRWRGRIEAGGLAIDGDRKAARFTEYKSLDNGLYLNAAQLEGDSPDGGLYIEARAAALGRDDQSVGLTVGRYNGWRLKSFYNETPHVFTTGYRSLWDGVGTGRLTLKKLPAAPGAPATAASTDIAIGAEALAAPASTLSLVRQKGGLRLDLPIGDTWKAYASLTSEKRQGARPFGLVSGGGGGTGGLETAEPIDHDTHEVLAGVQWSDARTSVNVAAMASLFRNNIGTLTIDNPLFLAAANGVSRFPQAVIDLHPDNDFYNLKAEFAHAVPELAKARLTGVVSLSSSRQNDALIPSTPYADATVGGIGGGSWNTLDSLSRRSAERQIDSRLADFSLALQPAPSLDLRARLRQHETIDDSPQYWACNPLTGQWGRLVNDGSGGAFATANVTAGINPAGTVATAYNALACNVEAIQALKLVPSAGNINIASAQYEVKQTQASVSGDWRPARGQTLNLLVEREQVDRTNRERARTWEDRLKFGYVNRSLAGGTVRLSAEASRRRGSTYVADPYDAFYSASLGPLPTVSGTAMTSWIHVNDLHRKFDLADRDTRIVNARFNTALSGNLDLSLNGQFKEQTYPGSAYGRNGTQRLNSLNAELNWQPTAVTSVYGYVSTQLGRMAQQGLQQNACVLGTTYHFFSDGSVGTTATLTPAQQAAGITVVGTSGVVTAANWATLCGSASPTSPLYPTSRAWTVVQDDRNQSLGLGVRHEFGRVRTELNYSYSDGRTGTSYTYNAAALGLVTSGAPTATQLASLALIGSGMPDLHVRQQVLDLNVVVPVAKTATVRFMLRHEEGRITDWHYDGVAANPTPSTNQQTYLDSGPQGYRATAVGVMLGLVF